ncbi:hypothetical protein [Kribbella swartbergensis]
MPRKRLGEKVGDKLEEGLEQAMAGVKDLATKAGVGSGDDTGSSTRKKATRTRTSTAGRTREGAVGRTREAAGRVREEVGGRTRGRAGATGRTKDELYADAARLGIKGRSRMTKAELEKAVRRG